MSAEDEDGVVGPDAAAVADAGPHAADAADAVDAGPDAVRAALNRARATARERGDRPGRPGERKPSRAAAAMRRRGAATRSGAHPDERDPQTFGSVIQRMIAERGWQVPLSVGGVMGRWDSIVGADVAAHCRPETFDEGVLTVVADSTAWATQVRLLTPKLLARLADEVGEGTVTRLVVRGPGAPSWHRGPRVAPEMRGPRDTYG